MIRWVTGIKIFFQGSQIKVRKSQKVLASNFKLFSRKLEKTGRVGNFAPHPSPTWIRGYFDPPTKKGGVLFRGGADLGVLEGAVVTKLRLKFPPLSEEGGGVMKITSE